ncbi:MAG: general secretion pathway protein GspK [Nitrospirae bacterium]|nr:general secretion pathway protein GspK [Nitrospirota bacterium]
MRFRTILGSKNGIALLMVMVLITMLTIMSVEVAETGQSHYLITTSLRDTVKARALAHSGVHTVGALLKADAEGLLPSTVSKKDVDYLGEPWNLQPPANELPLGEGRVQAFVEDEMSKLNAQEMSEEQLACLAKEVKVELDVKNAYRWIKEWSTSSEKGDNFDEDYYSARIPPILRSDAPFETVSELGLVEGIGWSNLEKLRPFLTVYPRWQAPPPRQGETNPAAPQPPRFSKVNVNTVKREVLACLAPEFERAAEEIIRRREEKPFDRIDATQFTGIFQGTLPAQYMTVKSDVFSVTSIGRVGAEGSETTVVVTAVINRSKSGRSEMEFLYWREQ